MKEQYFKELSRCLRKEQIESIAVGEDQFKVYLGGKPVLSVSPNSEVYILPAGSGSEEVDDLYHRVAAIADEVHEYVEAVENAPILRAADLHEEFHLLADFGGAVLAGREREKGLGYEFVTWIWDYSRTGVSRGHYYDDSFREAKQDFAVRSGLISRAQLFTPEELTEMYRATDFFLDEGPEPGVERLKARQEARTKIEYTVPDLQSRLEQAQNQKPQMNF